MSSYLSPMVSLKPSILVFLLLFLTYAIYLYAAKRGSYEHTLFVKSRKRKSRLIETQYLENFPPSRLHTLDLLPSNSSSFSDRKSAAQTLTPSALQQNALSTTKTPTEHDEHLYTATGFRLGDIEAVGRFPDYNALSGVPHPKPWPQFDIATASFRPYRPFRWGYHQTMSLFKLDKDFWIELDHSYFDRLKKRQELLTIYGSRIMALSPGAEIAARELMEMVVQFVSIRYPHLFSLQEENTILVNKLLKTRTRLTQTAPLQVLFDNIPEDFVIMLRNEKDGMYYLRGGIICSSVGWNLGMHLNKPLRDIHEQVTDYKEKLMFSMDRYFSKMPTDQPIQRASWNLCEGECMHIAPEHYTGDEISEHFDMEDCQLRVDFQTLRRLPLSGAVLFNFKVIFTPFVELRYEPYIPSLMRKQITDGKKELIAKKVPAQISSEVLHLLEEWEREQIETGIVPVDWEVQTLDESPFYPGWEGLWQKKLNFES